MKSLLQLWQNAADELAAWCCTHTARDLKTVTCRTKNEGTSFLTITLPNFGKDFERSLDQGFVDSSLFNGFHFREGLPVFLSGFLSQVFERGSGMLVPDPSIDAIFAIRELTLMFGKIHLPCSDARREKALDGYLECESIVRDFDMRRTESEMAEFKRMSGLLWAELFTKADRDVWTGENLLPRHGGGATAGRLLGNAKYDDLQWTNRMEQILPSGEFLLTSWSHRDRLDDVDYRDPGDEEPTRVTCVPKTLKTPRIIAIEPVCMMYAQQAIFGNLVGHLRSDACRWLVDWSTQEPNRHLAWKGSLKGELATLDLSDASDRVSNELVRTMLSNFPHLAEAVDATRSQKAHIPDRGVHSLAKFASMGSALCFPMEAFVFATIVFLGIQDALDIPLSRNDIQSFRGEVRLFGDDIIVPEKYVRCVVDRLEAFGLKVNHTKSFWTGRFRESCGKEFYAGEDVSIVRVRHKFSPQHMDASEKISVYSMRNQFYMVGMWKTARYLDDWIERNLKFNPTVHPSSPVLGRWTCFFDYQVDRVHPTRHSPQVKGYVTSAKLAHNSVDGLGALLKVMLTSARKEADGRPFVSTLDSKSRFDWVDQLFPPSVDEHHLSRSGRPVAVNTKLRYGSPY